jgi:hypothetical protein
MIVNSNKLFLKIYCCRKDILQRFFSRYNYEVHRKSSRSKNEKLLLFYFSVCNLNFNTLCS